MLQLLPLPPRLSAISAAVDTTAAAAGTIGESATAALTGDSTSSAALAPVTPPLPDSTTTSDGISVGTSRTDAPGPATSVPNPPVAGPATSTETVPDPPVAGPATSTETVPDPPVAGSATSTETAPDPPVAGPAPFTGPFRVGDTLEALIVRTEAWALFDALAGTVDVAKNPRLIKRTLSGTSDELTAVADMVRDVTRARVITPDKTGTLTMTTTPIDAVGVDPYR